MKTLRLPLLLFVLPAVLLGFAASRSDLLLLDRSALETGEVWRLWTGHWMHFSPAHLGGNLLVLLIAGTCLERLQPGLLLRHIVLGAPLIGVAILILEPALQTYGGLSGLATSVVVLLALRQLPAPGSPRFLWAGVLVVVAGKAIYDTTHPLPLLVEYSSNDIRSSSIAHAAGAVTGLMLHFIGGHHTKRTAHGCSSSRG